MEDPFLNYLSLGFLIFVIIVLFYGIIAIHDIPAKIAHSRDHPHQDAIHAAGWVSLFLLHVLWPFLWIWAMAYRPERGWGFGQKPGEPASRAEAATELDELKHRLAEIEARLGTQDQSVHLGESRIRPRADLPDPMASTAERENAPTTQRPQAGSPAVRR